MQFEKVIVGYTNRKFIIIEDKSVFAGNKSRSNHILILLHWDFN